MVYPREREVVLGAALVNGGEVDAHAELLRLLLIHQDRVRDPVRVLDLSNESGVKQPVDLLADGVSFATRKASHSLLDGSGVLVDA